MTLSVKTLSLMTLSLMTLSLMTLSLMTLILMTLSIMTPSMKTINVLTSSIKSLHRNKNVIIKNHHPEVRLNSCKTRAISSKRMTLSLKTIYKLTNRAVSYNTLCWLTLFWVSFWQMSWCQRNTLGFYYTTSYNKSRCHKSFLTFNHSFLLSFHNTKNNGYINEMV